MRNLSKFVTFLSVLIIGFAIVVAIHKPVSATTKTETVEKQDSPYEFSVSSEQPSSVTELDQFSTSRNISLAADGVIIDRYDIYDTPEGNVLALHFTPVKEGMDSSQVMLGLLLRGHKSATPLMTASGNLATFQVSSDNFIRQEPFTIWLTFESVRLDLLMDQNGETWAREVMDSFVEIYLTDEKGITFSPDGRKAFTDETSNKTEYVSTFVPIVNFQAFGENQN